MFSDKRAVKKAMSDGELYDHLCFAEVCRALTNGERVRLMELHKVRGPKFIKNDQGEVVMQIGSREEQIDRARHAIIRKMVEETATEADILKLQRLSEERVTRMMPSRRNWRRYQVSRRLLKLPDLAA